MGDMDATATVGRRVAVPEGYGEKRCPRCGEVLFDDMDVCYGCLYDFGRNREEDLARAGIPEEFALLEGGLEEPEGFGEAHARELPERPDLRVWLRTDSADVILPLPGEGSCWGPTCPATWSSTPSWHLPGTSGSSRRTGARWRLTWTPGFPPQRTACPSGRGRSLPRASPLPSAGRS